MIKNIFKAFRIIGLYPFNLDYIIYYFIIKKESRPLSSKSIVLAIPMEDWRYIRKLIRETISNKFN